MINWLQSRTQFAIAYKFSRAAAAASGPTYGDVKQLNKVVRTIRAQPVALRFWPLSGPLRIIGEPDASYRNNADGSSQRAQVIFVAEARGNSQNSRGSLVDYESTKITRTTMSTTVAELYALMKCFGTCQFVRGLWMACQERRVPSISGPTPITCAPRQRQPIFPSRRKPST